MSHLHPTDENLQLYAMDPEQTTSDVVSHVEICSPCRQKVESYRLLMEDIKAQPSPVFDFDIAEVVMAQLPVDKQTESTAGDRPIIYSVVFILIVLGSVIAYYFGTYLVDLFSVSKSMVIYLGATILLVISAFVMTDMILRYRKQLKTLHFS